jgi:hypothetical protein
MADMTCTGVKVSNERSMSVTAVPGWVAISTVTLPSVPW